MYHVLARDFFKFLNFLFILLTFKIFLK